MINDRSMIIFKVLTGFQNTHSSAADIAYDLNTHKTRHTSRQGQRGNLSSNTLNLATNFKSKPTISKIHFTLRHFCSIRIFECPGAKFYQIGNKDSLDRKQNIQMTWGKFRLCSEQEDILVTWFSRTNQHSAMIVADLKRKSESSLVVRVRKP